MAQLTLSQVPLQRTHQPEAHTQFSSQSLEAATSFSAQDLLLRNSDHQRSPQITESQISEPEGFNQQQSTKTYGSQAFKDKTFDIQWSDVVDSAILAIGLELSEENFFKSTLSSANFRRMDFSNATLDLNSPTIYAQTSEAESQLRSSGQCPGCNLRGTNLSGLDLSNADLSGADLSNANLSGADLSNANLRDANLNNIDLSGTNLINADLNGAAAYLAKFVFADLKNADLKNANLTSADFENADLTNAKLAAAKLTYANGVSANMEATDLSGTDLSDINLSKANLSNAILTGSNMRYADLTDANLTGANLERVDLRVANLQTTNLTGANLTGADLRGAQQFETANQTDLTLVDASLPEDTDPPYTIASTERDYTLTPLQLPTTRLFNLETANQIDGGSILFTPGTRLFFGDEFGSGAGAGLQVNTGSIDYGITDRIQIGVAFDLFDDPLSRSVRGVETDVVFVGAAPSLKFQVVKSDLLSVSVLGSIEAFRITRDGGLFLPTISTSSVSTNVLGGSLQVPIAYKLSEGLQAHITPAVTIFPDTIDGAPFYGTMLNIGFGLSWQFERVNLFGDVAGPLTGNNAVRSSDSFSL